MILKRAYRQMLGCQANTTMHGVLNTMDSCYLKRTTPIHFWIGGQPLKTGSDGM
jgi:hypothetical protein